MIEDGSNYGDFLLKTIEGAKDQFKADELKLLKRRCRTDTRDRRSKAYDIGTEVSRMRKKAIRRRYERSCRKR